MRLFFILAILFVAILGSILFFVRGYAKSPKVLATEKARDSEEWIKNAVIYEIFIRNFTSEGTFRAMESRLLELKKLGINTLWLMPIHPIGEMKRKGSLGSPYSIKDYYGINSEYGTKEDFKHLVEVAHKEGFKVVFDFVGNHTSWDNSLIKSKPNFYRKGKSGEMIPPVEDWTDIVAFDFTNEELRTYLIDVMKYWVKEYDIDGYRCDVAEFVPSDFWLKASEEVRKIKPSFLMLAEGTLPELHVSGFDLTYSWTIYDALSPILKGNKSAMHLDTLLETESKVFPQGSLRLRFNTNHDKNIEDGSPFEHFGGDPAAKATTLLVFTMGGYGSIRSVPMLYNGDEIGNRQRIGMFEKSSVNWNKTDAENYRRFYTDLILLRKSESALVQGDMQKLKTSSDENVFAFTRSHNQSKVFVIVNLKKQPFTGYVKVDEGKLLADFFEREKQVETKDGNLKISLEPFGYKVFIFKH